MGQPGLTKLCGKDCEGYYFSTHYAPDTAAPVALKFIEAYKAAYGGMPDDVAALTYDSFGLLSRQYWTRARSTGRPYAMPGKVQKYEGVTGDMHLRKARPIR